MGLDTDDEILQDFLVEAGEIMEGLTEQLVELESQPEDSELLNSIFRGFHTIKGGAGFLSLDAMVALCHKCEDLFNILRQGDRIVDPDMMDTFLKVTDSLTVMFEEVTSGEFPGPAPSEIITQLSFFLDPNSAPEVAVPEPEPVAEVKVESSSSDSDDISDDEFEALLDQLHGSGTPGASTTSQEKSPTPSPTPSAAPNSDDITEEEFEALLDELQGKIKTKPTSPPIEQIISAPESVPPPPKVDTTSEKIKTAAKPASPAKQVEASVRVDTRRLDDIMNLVGELVLVRNRINTLEAAMKDGEMAKAVNNLTVVTADLQAAVMKTRMQPIKKVFGRFPRVVRDLARSLNKEINLELRGEETDLDKNLVEALADPLVHLVRNAVDHGIEMPDIREKANKSRTGHIILSAAQEGEHILLIISDDGAGMDANILRQKAVEKGMLDEESASRLTDSEAYSLIFSPGFSLKKEISDISGRGVGMDVVKTSIAKLNGVIDIVSDVGKGTTLTIKVPLTLAIMPTLMVMLGDQIFAFPLVSVNEIFHLDLTKTNVIDGQQTITVRNRVLPLFYLRKWLASTFNETETPEFEHVVIVQVGTQRVGFVVDKLIGQEEVVIKPLGALLQGTKGLAGATITGDGRIALILEFPELMNNYANRGY